MARSRIVRSIAPRHRTVLAAALGLLVGCARAPAPSQPPLPSVAPPYPLPAQPAGWPYWQAPVLDLHPPPERAGATPEATAPAWLVSDTAWRGSQAAILAKLREDGLAIHAVKSSEVRLGAFYEERARRGAPLLVTFDALFAVTHLALASVAADVEERSMRGDDSRVLLVLFRVSTTTT